MPVVAVAISTLLSIWLRPLVTPTPYLLYYPAVFVSALYGGMGPALLAAALSLLLANYFLIPPLHVISIGPQTPFQAIALLSVAAMAGWLSAALTHANELAVEQARARSEAEAEREAAQRLAAIVQSSHDSINGVDLGGKITFWNASAQRLYGYSEEEAVGRHVSMLAPPDRMDEARGFLERIRRGESVEHYETKRLRKDGTLVDVSISVSPVKDRKGEVAGAAAVVRDITESKRAEAALRESEEQLRVLYDQNPAMVILSDLEDGCIIRANEAFTRMLGYSIEEAVGRTSVELGIFPSREDRERLTRAVRVEGSVRNAEIAVRAKSGATVAGLLSAARIELGGRSRLVSVVADIAERKRAEEALRALQAVTAALSAAKTPGEVVRVMADEAVRAMGAAAGAVSLLTDGGRELEHLTAASYPPETEAVWHRYSMDLPTPMCDAVRSGQPVLLGSAEEWDARYSTLAPENRRLGYGAAAAIPLVLGGQVLGGIALSFVGPRAFPEEDVALLKGIAAQVAQALERARLYEEERQARAEAQEANEAKDRFLALVSHELRNPLSAITAGLRLLRQSLPAEERAVRALEVVERNTALQTRLVNDLLDLSRLQRGKLQLQMAPVDLGEAAAAACRSYEEEMREAGLALTCHAQPGLWVCGDPDRLHQVVMNLLSNAAKFTPGGGSVAVTAERHDDACARVTVADTGIGLDQALKEHLFEMFHQGEVAGRRKPGLGLGLALVKGIVERHGGRVWAESEGPGKGSRFIFDLPLVEAPAGHSRPAGETPA